MKFSKLGFMIATAMFAVGAFADAANVLISFSTTADYYADGEKVKNGEWYALCWSQDGNFEGLNLDCTPVDSNDKVLILAPLAKDGKCPHVLFQLESNKVPNGGEYFVYLLDTRDVTGKKVAGNKPTEDGRNVPAITNGSLAATDGVTVSKNVGSKVVKTTSVSGDVAWAPVQPKITAFEVEGATVKITVAGMLLGRPYKVNMGATPDDLTAYEFEQQNEDGEAFFRINPDNARFFQVIAE